MKFMKPLFLALCLQLPIQTFGIRFVKPKIACFRVATVLAFFAGSTVVITKKYPQFVKKISTLFYTHPKAYSLAIATFAIPSMIHMIMKHPKKKKRKNVVSTEQKEANISTNVYSENHWMALRRDSQGLAICGECNNSIPRGVIGNPTTRKRCDHCGKTYCLPCIEKVNKLCNHHTCKGRYEWLNL